MTILRISIAYLVDIISWIIVIKSFMSWVPSTRQSRIYKIMDDITEPIEGPIRRVMYKYYDGPVDFSPVVAIIILMFVKGRLI
ncbi:YggT family protein [Peptacetobacter hominis]|uniref:YggT family protein n=1 Tax=Peptacetobacter hominis TaxID=2743610 RepID=A0A544QUS2_9FIRM|nr:YggT family protein [Peptacetobacter hominis]TQQ84451.1 YggT family protein [Peptacetobacter hominis]